MQVEKDEGYIRAVMALSGAAERIVKENNAIDIYEEYWEGAQRRRQQWSPEALNPPHPAHALLHLTRVRIQGGVHHR